MIKENCIVEEVYEVQYRHSPTEDWKLMYAYESESTAISEYGRIVPGASPGATYRVVKITSIIEERYKIKRPLVTNTEK